MKSSISLCTMIFDFLMATTCRSKSPLYTTPCPPPPIWWDGSNLFVAFSRSCKVMIILPPISEFCDTNCWSSSPWFCLKNLSFSFLTLCSLILRVMKGAPSAKIKQLMPQPTPSPIFKTAAYNKKCHNFDSVNREFYLDYRLGQGIYYSIWPYPSYINMWLK